MAFDFVLYLCYPFNYVSVALLHLLLIDCIPTNENNILIPVF